MQKQEIIVIGDIHGESRWKEIVERHPGEKYIFLGDYCDPYNQDLLEDDVLNNLSQIIKFKQEHRDNVILLLGNHDMQYIDDTAELCSRYMVRINEEIEELFGSRVRALVESETEDKRADLPPSDTWRIRKEESLSVLKNTDDIAVLIVWLGDKLANMRSFYRIWKTEGDSMWQSFNQKDPEQQFWYYNAIAELMADGTIDAIAAKYKLDGQLIK